MFFVDDIFIGNRSELLLFSLNKLHEINFKGTFEDYESLSVVFGLFDVL